MKTLEVIRVEDWDGGERHNFVCYVDADVAEQGLKKRWPHGLFTRQVITVFDSIEEVDQNTNLKLRQSAWDKLSPQERQALNMLERPTK